MGMITVRVTPRSGRTEVEAGSAGIIVRVRAAPEGGRATDEALRAIARAVGVPPTDVRLVKGVRSRTKVFEVRGITADDLQVRLRAT
jgi:uncharacterized protein YggU (UPF0235/DUF167 family)